MNRTDANHILDTMNRTMDNYQGRETPADVEGSRRVLAEAGYPTRRSARTGYIVPVITRGLKWGEPDND